MKIVFDTNVYAQLATSGGFVDRMFRVVARRPDLQVYVSVEILAELKHVLVDKLQLSSERTAELMQQVRSIAIIVDPSRVVDGVLRDADDHKILECALEVRADCIVTSDRELLQLAEFKRTKIVHPSVMKFTGAK